MRGSARQEWRGSMPEQGNLEAETHKALFYAAVAVALIALMVIAFTLS